MSEVRVPFLDEESLTQGLPVGRIPFLDQEALTEGVPPVRVAFVDTESLSEAIRNLRLTYFIIESLHPVPPEPFMSTIPFPGFGNSAIDPTQPAGADPFNTALPGLTFSVHKKPNFNTRISTASSGKEVRNALMKYPTWDYELTYDFLEDKSGVNSSLKTIMGFFLSRQGAYDSWLFKDPDDYISTYGSCGTTDAVTTQFFFARNMGSFSEAVGQVDTANAITVYLGVAENKTVPSMAPYTVTVNNAGAFDTDLGVTRLGVPLVKVTGAPAAGQYSVSAGVYTFNSASAGLLMVISYRYLVSSSLYTVTMPNLIVFTSAPAAGTLYASFQYFFVCRFTEDQMDFEKFYDKLWNLQTCSFKSLVQ